jgi:hypothetical protein
MPTHALSRRWLTLLSGALLLTLPQAQAIALTVTASATPASIQGQTSQLAEPRPFASYTNWNMWIDS